METFVVDPRQTTPEEHAEGMRQAQTLFKLGQTMPYTPEYDALVKDLFGKNLGSGVRVMPGLTGVCFDHVKIGDNALIMNNCLLMSRGGITIEENAIFEVNQQVILAGLYTGGFFESAAFYGGTCFGLQRFSEDMDFSLLEPDSKFDFSKYFQPIVDAFSLVGRKVEIKKKDKKKFWKGRVGVSKGQYRRLRCDISDRKIGKNQDRS